MGAERDFAWGSESMMQYADDILFSCTLETCMVLQTNVAPINSIQNKCMLSLLIQCVTIHISLFKKVENSYLGFPFLFQIYGHVILLYIMPAEENSSNQIRTDSNKIFSLLLSTGVRYRRERGEKRKEKERGELRGSLVLQRGRSF